MMHAKWMISWAYLTQGIRTIINYLASSTKSATVNKVATKKTTREQCQMLSSLTK